MLNLFRNLGLITGASVMGAIFAVGTGAVDMALAVPEATAIEKITFAVAAMLFVVALAIAVASRAKPR